jgi:hypothetical protein
MTLTEVALSVAALWLTVLTIVSILLIRQIALLTVRLEQNGESFNPQADGPTIGDGVPQEVLKMLPKVSTEPVYLVSVSATCTSCRELLGDLRRRSLPGDQVAIFLSGPSGAAEAASELIPPRFQVIRDEDAKIASALHITSTPFAVAIQNEVVVAKTYLFGVDDLVDLVSGTHTQIQPIPQSSVA